MSSEMNWALDFCLYCDKQTSSAEPYCSQECRLADLEKPGFSSAPASPGFDSSSMSKSTWHYSSGHVAAHSSQFNLPPPFNFDFYRQGYASKIESPPPSPRTSSFTTSSSQQVLTMRPTLPYRATWDHAQIQNRSLNPSSSRSSLSSVSSANSTQGLSDQALSQLQGYANSFDHVRDWKRRVTLG